MILQNDPKLNALIEQDDSEGIVSYLEEKIEANNANATEELLCGVMLLLPPFCDYEAAKPYFQKNFDGVKGQEAIMWDAFRYSAFAPDGDLLFLEKLKTFSDSSLSMYLLSLVYEVEEEFDLAEKALLESANIKLFPNNIIQLVNKGNLTSISGDFILLLLNDLVLDKTYENSPSSATLEGALQGFWDSLIVGNRQTSYQWSELESKIRGRR